MIRVSSLCKNYGPHKAVENLTFEIQPGRLVGFLGPNGAGKTTTMKLLSGFLMPSSGDVWVDDVHLYDYPVESKKKIGYLPETAPLYDDMSVEEFLLFTSQLKGSSLAQSRQQMEKVLTQAGLEDVYKRPIYKLSKGYRQRVGLAQAIVAEPKLLLLDEPTSGFDPKQASEFRQLLIQLKGEMTIFLSTHILSEVETSCDEIVVINKGHIITQGSYRELTRRLHKGKCLLLYVKSRSTEFDEALEKLPLVTNWSYDDGLNCYQMDHKDEDITDTVLQIALKLKVGIVKVDSDSKDLEELFLELTQSEDTEADR